MPSGSPDCVCSRWSGSPPKHHWRFFFFPVSVFFIIILRYFPWCLACCRWEREKLYVWIINSPSAGFPAKYCTNQSVCSSAALLVCRITAEFNHTDTKSKVVMVARCQEWGEFKRKKRCNWKLLKLREDSHIFWLSVCVTPTSCWQLSVKLWDVWLCASVCRLAGWAQLCRRNVHQQRELWLFLLFLLHLFLFCLHWCVEGALDVVGNKFKNSN